jgi:predicted peptidase
MTRPRRLPYVLILLALGAPVHAFGQTAGQAAETPPRSQATVAALARVQVRSHVLPEAPGVDVPYAVYVPTGYDASRPTPLVIALHGLGSGVMYMMEYGNARTSVVELAEQHGYLVATPMGFNERGWYGSRGADNSFSPTGPANLGELSERDVLAVLGIMKREFSVDPDRTYLIGQSMGGGGTWHIGMKYPAVWAALVPMAPAIYSDPEVPVAARHLPIMVIHGDADETVTVDISRRWTAKLRELGMTHEYIEVAGGTHASAGRDNIDRVFAFLARHRR